MGNGSVWRRAAAAVVLAAAMGVSVAAQSYNAIGSGGPLRSELHGVGVGCYMKIPSEIEIHEDNQVRTLGGWEIDGVPEDDVPRYEGVLTMHEHFIDCVVANRQPITDIRDVIHSIALVDQIEAAEIMATKT